MDADKISIQPKSSEISIVKRGLSDQSGNSTLGIPGKFRKHRRSSIPFADRSPQVRFVKRTEEHSISEPGNFSPILDDAPSGGNRRASETHPILKHTNFPILIDLNRNDEKEYASPSGERVSVNQLIEASTNYVERVNQHFSATDRDTRGALDILTFPISTSMGIEALARFYCGFAVTIVCVEDLLIITAKLNSTEFKSYIQQVAQLAAGLLDELATFGVESRALLTKVRRRHKQWGKLLISSRGEFKVEERTSNIPVYAKKTMPESVTLYENEVGSDNTTFRTDGKVQFLRTEGELQVMVELKQELISRTQEELDDKELFCLIKCLMNQAHELLFYAILRLRKASEAMDSPVFDDEYAILKERMANFEFDAYFDPLCALELKSTLIEVVARKEELLNTAQHVVKYGDKMTRFVKLFGRYCKSVGVEKKHRRCCHFGRVNCDKLFESMDNIDRMDFMVSIPLTDAFIKEFCHMEVKPTESEMPVQQNTEKG